jgi:uncharacterized protein
MALQDQAKKPRGFAAMTPERRREVASAAGKAAHAQGRAPEFTPEQARAAGRKGGEAVSADREHMRAIGRRGGERTSADPAHMAEIGRAGGNAAHANGAAHQWTAEEARAARRKVGGKRKTEALQSRNAES